jgi:hypothetical protein
MATAFHAASDQPRFPSPVSCGDRDDSGLPNPYPSTGSDDRTDRIRAVFGLRGGARLPEVNPATLRAYLEHLRPRLTTPFEADYCPQTQAHIRTVLVVGLRSLRKSGGDVSKGLYCVARDRDRAVEVPLADLEVPQDDPNFQLLEDYWFWVWNWGSESETAANSGNPDDTWS